MTDRISARVAELRGAAGIVLAAAFGLLIIGSMSLALRGPEELGSLAFGIAFIGLAAVAGIASLVIWLVARKIDRETMIVRGNGRHRVSVGSTFADRYPVDGSSFHEDCGDR